MQHRREVPPVRRDGISRQPSRSASSPQPSGGSAANSIGDGAATVPRAIAHEGHARRDERHREERHDQPEQCARASVAAGTWPRHPLRTLHSTPMTTGRLPNRDARQRCRAIATADPSEGTFAAGCVWQRACRSAAPSNRAPVPGCGPAYRRAYRRQRRDDRSAFHRARSHTPRCPFVDQRTAHAPAQDSCTPASRVSRPSSVSPKDDWRPVSGAPLRAGSESCQARNRALSPALAPPPRRHRRHLATRYWPV